jgi:hypothetical protein
LAARRLNWTLARATTFVFSTTISAEIDLGAGNDVLLHAGRGSVVHTGPGGADDQDTILFSKGILVTDADGYDKVGMAWGLLVPTLALAGGKSETPWAYGGAGLYKVGFNVAGEMVLGWSWTEDGDLDQYMYFANGNSDPLAPAAELTAGIRVATTTWEAWQLRNIPENRHLSENASLWDFVRVVLKDFHDEHEAGGIDPLVLDLDGDGIELSA